MHVIWCILNGVHSATRKLSQNGNRALAYGESLKKEPNMKDGETERVREREGDRQIWSHDALSKDVT